MTKERSNTVFGKHNDKNSNIKQKVDSKKMEIDPTEYDLSTGLHDDPVRNPPTPIHYRNDKGEWDAMHEPYWLSFIRKSKPRDYTVYHQALHEYWNIANKYQLKDC